ncbi:hypothetical protein OROGR_029427 [Orobanche gracilis]
MSSSSDQVSSSTKCYSAILWRLLCSGSQPTHPSDQFLKSNIEKMGDRKVEESSKPVENAKNSVYSNPGVVARLMGLDSFPNTSSARKNKTLGSFFRSRSMNSIDFLPHFDPVERHRRVRSTSVLFRGGIYYHDSVRVVSDLEKVDQVSGEDEDKLLNKKEKRGTSENSENFRGTKAITKPGRKVEMEEEKRIRPVEMEEEQRIRTVSSRKKDLHGLKRESLKERRRTGIKNVKSKEDLMMASKCLKKRQNKILTRKENSQSKGHPRGVLPEVAGKVSSRQVLPSETAGTTDHSHSPYSNSGQSHNAAEAKAFTDQGEKKKKKKRKEIKDDKNKENSCQYKRMTIEIICGLSEESVNENWNIYTTHESVLKFDDFEEICREFGQEILEALLTQIVDELIRTPTLWDKLGADVVLI